MLEEKKTFVNNTLLIGVSKLSTQVLAFVVLPIYTSLLSAREYGIFDLIVGYGALLAPLAMLNMQSAAFRYLIDVRNDNVKKAKVITAAFELSFYGTTALAVIALLFGLMVGGHIFFYAAGYVIAVLFSDLMLQVARGLGRIRLFTWTSLAQGFLGAGLSLTLLLVFNAGIEGLVVGMALGMLLPAVVLMYLLGVHSFIGLRFRSYDTRHAMLGYALPLIPNSASWWVLSLSGRTIISVVMGVAANGIYAVASKFSGVLYNIWGIFYQALSETVIINFDKSNRDSYLSSLFDVTVRIFSSICMLGIALTGLAFDFFVAKEFRGAYVYVPALMTVGLISTAVGFYSTIYVAQKETKKVMNTSLLVASISVILSLTLVWSLGLWGIILASFIAYVVILLYRYYDIKRIVEIRYNKRLIAGLAVGMAVAVTLYYGNTSLQFLNLALVVVLSCTLNLKSMRFIKKHYFTKIKKPPTKPSPPPLPPQIK